MRYFDPEKTPMSGGAGGVCAGVGVVFGVGVGGVGADADAVFGDSGGCGTCACECSCFCVVILWELAKNRSRFCFPLSVHVFVFFSGPILIAHLTHTYHTPLNAAGTAFVLPLFLNVFLFAFTFYFFLNVFLFFFLFCCFLLFQGRELSPTLSRASASSATPSCTRWDDRETQTPWTSPR